MELSEYEDGCVHINVSEINRLMIYLLSLKSVMQKMAISASCAFQSNTCTIKKLENDRTLVKYNFN